MRNPIHSFSGHSGRADPAGSTFVVAGVTDAPSGVVPSFTEEDDSETGSRGQPHPFVLAAFTRGGVGLRGFVVARSVPFVTTLTFTGCVFGAGMTSGVPPASSDACVVSAFESWCELPSPFAEA